MKRLVKSYCSIDMNKDVQYYIEHNENILDNEYIPIAKKILSKLRIIPTNERVLRMSEHIMNGDFQDLCKDIKKTNEKEFSLIVNKAEEILKKENILF